MKGLFAFLAAATISVAANAAPAPAATTASAEPAVKKSSSGICHEKGLNGYGQTKKFTAFNSIDECVKSGGRASKESPGKKADAKPADKPVAT